MAFYDAIPASDGTSLTAPENAEFKVYEVSDTARANPLPLLSTAGLNAAPLVTTAQGVVPPVEVVSPNFEHIFVSGGWEWRRESSEGIKRAAEQSAKDAASARLAAEASAKEAQKPTDESVDRGIQRADIPGKVAEAVGAAPTVVQAAAAAVGGALTDASLLTGAYPIDHDQVTFGITDDSDRRSWMEIAPDGGPTAHSVKLLTDKLPDPTIEAFDHNAGYVFAIVDEQDRIAAGVRSDGRFVIPDQETEPPRIVAWGDSLTHSDGGIWPSRLGNLLRASVAGRGVSGERAEGIAARQGGIRRILTIQGGTIPGSGPVSVTADGVFVLPNANSSKGVQDGYLAGIHGTISAGASENEFVFTRTTSDSPLSVNAAPWITDDSVIYRDDLPIFWIGRNNFPYDIDNGPDVAGAALRSMIDHQNNGSKFVILTVLNGRGEGRTGNPAAHAAVTSYAQWLKTEYPHQVMDIRRYLIDRGLGDAGISPTTQDLADMADDTVPASLRKDWIHLTPKGYELVANQIAAFITSKGML